MLVLNGRGSMSPRSRSSACPTARINSSISIAPSPSRSPFRQTTRPLWPSATLTIVTSSAMPTVLSSSQSPVHARLHLPRGRAAGRAARREQRGAETRAALTPARNPSACHAIGSYQTILVWRKGRLWRAPRRRRRAAGGGEMVYSPAPTARRPPGEPRSRRHTATSSTAPVAAIRSSVPSRSRSLQRDARMESRRPRRAAPPRRCRRRVPTGSIRRRRARWR